LIWVPALAVGVAMLLPAVYLVIQAAQLPLQSHPGDCLVTQHPAPDRPDAGAGGGRDRGQRPAGVPVAWLTVRSDLPARRFFAIATAMPLVIPSYVGAYALIAAIAPGGLVESWLGVRPPSPYGFGGAFIALTLFSFPYVIITVQAALRGTDHNLEQASRSLGHGPCPRSSA
jgi:iron(III) transport system permease protein